MNGKTIQSREVFLSSTTSDLMQYRLAAHEVIKALNEEFSGQYSLTGTSMISETQDGERQTAVAVSRDWVAKADWVVLIVGWNYGFVPELDSQQLRESWEPCSVTEWEYRQATDVSKTPKKCFVFMAGERSDGAEFEYRPLPDAGKEPVNLMSFLGSDGTGKLVAFRKALRGERHELFKNIEHFRQRLTLTLRRKIQKELRPDDELDLESVLMITGLLTPVRACIEVVKTLATLKRLHDRLHKIRQWGIRRWREEVLTRWQEDSKLPIDAERIYLKGQNNVNKRNGEIDGLFKSLGPDLQKALHLILRVVDHFDVDDDSLPQRRQAFEQSTDLFASRVQAAFTACNWQMMRAATQLTAVHGQLVAMGRSALGSTALKPAERELLREEIIQTMRLHDRLQLVLAQHNGWQRIHDSLQRVDDWRRPEQADDESEREAFETIIMPVLDSAQDMRDLMDSAAPLLKGDGVNAGWQVLTDNVRRNLSLLVDRADEATYEAMRKAFDDLFFEVDIETLDSVEHSERRSRGLEANLLDKEVEFAALRATWRAAAERRPAKA